MPTEVSAQRTITLPGSVTEQNSTLIRFPIVALGAGDIDGLQRFLAATPAASDSTFIIVTDHKLGAEPPLVQLLQPYTSLPIQQVGEATPLEQNHVYLIPPTHLLIDLDTHFHLAPRTTTLAMPVDRCFAALAHAVMGHKVAGPIGAVVLAGTGADGAQGLTQVKAAGGFTACQAPLDRGQDALLVDALAVDEVDWVLPAEELPAKWVDYLQHHAQWLSQLTNGSLPPKIEQGLEQILAEVQIQTGHDFSAYKPNWLLAQLEHRMWLLGDLELSQYAKRLSEQPQETQTLRQAWLNSTSHFFHPPEAFASFQHRLMPRLLQVKTPKHPLRIWVVGCASGEEVYSLTMALLEYVAQLADPPELRIFATDVNLEALRKAREGLWIEPLAANVSPERLARFFTKEAGSYRIKPEVRECVIFGEHNLLQDPPFAKLSLIVCRDLLARLQNHVQNHLLELFHYLLQPHGYLWLGPDEEMARRELFQPIQPGYGHYRRALGDTPSQPFALVKQATPGQPELATPVQPAKRGITYEEVYTRQLEQYAPPGLLVDAAYTIVYYAASATLYLHQPSGEATEQVLKRVRPPLREALVMGLDQVFQKETTFQSQSIGVETDAGWRQVSVRVEPAKVDGSPFAMVLFNASEAPADAPTQQADVLEHTLTQLQAQLQTMQTEYEAAQEEMTAVNEELMALNEELTIKTAELEYSKKELQSTNEELLAINQENRKHIVELRQLTANLQNLIVATDIATLFVDNQLQIRWFTPRVSEIFNLWTGDQGRPLAHITHRLAYPDLTRDATVVLQTLRSYECETSSESGRWFFIRISPYRAVDQNVEGVVLTFFDITARKQAEDALRKLNANLERRVEERTQELTRSNHELDQFAYIASHDLKSPLRAIHNLAQWIEEDAASVLPTEAKGHLAKLHTRVKRMGKLVDDLLTYSRAGRHLHKPEWVDTARLVDDLRFFLAPPPGFRIELRGSLPKIYTERVPLETVLRNLIDNGIKHHHQPAQGLLQIFAQAEAEWTEFTLTDNGPGIAPQYHERIFQVFQSLRPREEVEGSGMGLAVVKKAIESRGGRIQLESDVGQGTTFRFTWPNMGDGG